MSTDRSVRTLIAAVLFMAALLLFMNHIVNGQSVQDWWLPLVLFAVGLAFALAPTRTRGVTALQPVDESTDVDAIRYVKHAPEPVMSAAPQAAPVPAPVMSAPAEAAPASEPGKPDDLTTVEGIGPKISAALIAAGIDSFTKLSKASDHELRAAIEAAHIRLAPGLSTWAEQATYLLHGDKEGFETLKATLKSGRRAGSSG